MAYSTMRRQDLKLVKQIGTGGFSSVYKAMWKSKEVAAKRLNEPDRHEIEVLSELDHPNIVKFFGVIDDEFDFYLILELCEGGDLRSYLNKHKGERLKQFYDWAKQAGKPIEYLNKIKIIHKDVKSSNYLIANGNLKLADFGLAKRTDVTITATGTATYAYMAPELLTEEKLSPSYDIFAYMVVIWELWTTQIPFEESEWFNIWHRVCIDDERLPIPPDMPEALVELMNQCWEKDRSKRPSIDHILSVLTAVEKEASPEATLEQVIPGSCEAEKATSPEATSEQLITGSCEAEKATSPEATSEQLIPGSCEAEKAASLEAKSEQLIPGSCEAENATSLEAKSKQLITGSCEAEKATSPEATSEQLVPGSCEGEKAAGSWMLEREFGQQDGPGKLKRVRGIVVNPTTEDIAVADLNSYGEVKVYSNEAEYRFSLDTTQGMTPGKRSRPCQVIASDVGIYYVTDLTQYVQVYNAQGMYKCRWVAVSPDNTPSDVEDTMLCGLTMDGNGQVLVGQVRTEPWYISKHRPNGSYVASIKVDIKPHSLAITSQDTIVIGDYINDTVQIVDNRGKVLHTLKVHPYGICCYQDVVFISNTDNKYTHEISCFSVHGRLIGSIPVQMRPYCITFTKGGHTLLVTCIDGVQVYSKKEIP